MRMPRVSPILPLILVWNQVSALDNVCYECATPLLKSKWYTTGLPNYPSTISFTPDCITSAPASKSPSACSGKCFEFTFPLDGSQQMVRGCWRDFVKGYDTLTEVGANRCEYSIRTTDNATTVNLNGERDTTTPVTLMLTCTPVAGADPCNKNFYSSTRKVIVGEDPEPLDGDRSKVEGLCTSTGATTNQATTGKECYSCSHFGNDGTCHRKSKSTCRDGAYCTKLDGKLGKNQVVLRGCVSVNPYGDVGTTAQGRDVCFHVDEKFDIGGLYGLGAQYNFDKNSYMCICKDDRCNTARVQSVILAGILSILASFPFLL